jgi:hypothetical protein
MKQLILLLCALPSLVLAQEMAPDTLMLGKKKEIRTDLVSVLAYSRINLSSEYFLNNTWSTGLSLGLSNSSSIDEDFDQGYRNNRPRYDLTPFVRYKLSKSSRNFYFAEFFVSANGGDFKEIVRIVETGGTAYYVNKKSTYFDVGAGGGLGYKLYIKDKFAIELLVSIGANLMNTDKSPDILSRTGLSFGYRF